MTVCKMKICQKKTNLDKYGFCEMHTDRNQNANNNESELPCDKCKKEVASGDKAMSCDLCSNWSRISCIKGMTESTDDALLNGNKCNGLK